MGGHLRFGGRIESSAKGDIFIEKHFYGGNKGDFTESGGNTELQKSERGKAEKEKRLLRRARTARNVRALCAKHLPARTFL